MKKRANARPDQDGKFRNGWNRVESGGMTMHGKNKTGTKNEESPRCGERRVRVTGGISRNGKDLKNSMGRIELSWPQKTVIKGLT